MAEGIAYAFFVEHNSQYLKYIRRSPGMFDPWDCSGMTIGGQYFIIEFKIRNTDARQYSGRTLIENSKIEALKEIWKTNPGIQILYICYFNDFCLSFNLSQRFKQGCNSDILSAYDLNCKRSMYNTDQQYDTSKRVNFLAFSAEVWRDKIIQYK
jgi:hypothetical protein